MIFNLLKLYHIYLKCLDGHELVILKARVFIRATVYPLHQDGLLRKQVMHHLLHPQHVLLVRECGAILVFRAPDSNVCRSPQCK